MPAAPAPPKSRANGGGIGAMGGGGGSGGGGGGAVEEAVHVVTVNVVGLTGLTVDTSQPPHVGSDGAAPPLPRQMKAVVAVLRDQQTHSVTGLSRGLVQSAVMERHSQMPNHQKYIALWEDPRKPRSSSSSSKPPASFEATIPVQTKQQQQSSSSEPAPRTTMQPHRNFELIVGLTPDASSKATPIGAASLPLAEAARLGGANGKVLLDLPVYNYASLTMDPFAKPAAALESAIPLPQKKQHRRKLSFSRKKRNSNSSSGSSCDGSTASAASTTAAMTREDVGTLAVVNQLQKLNALGYNYFMDPSRDAAVLRVELELHQKEGNVEMDWRAASFGNSNSNRGSSSSSSSSRSNHKNSGSSRQPRVVLLDTTTQEQAIETAAATTARSAAEVQQQQHAPMEPSIERVLSSEDDGKPRKQQRKEKAPTAPKQQGTPTKRAKSSSSASSTPEKIKQFRVRIIDQTSLDYEVNPAFVTSSDKLQQSVASTTTDNKLLVQEHAIERILSDQDEKSAKLSQEASLHNNNSSNNNNKANDEIEVKRLPSPVPEPVKVPIPSGTPRRRLSSSSPSRPSGQRSVVSAPATPERAAKTEASSLSPPKKLPPSTKKTKTTSDERSLYDVDSGRQHLTIKPLASNSSVARSRVSVVSTAPTAPVKNSPKASKSAANTSKFNNNKSEAASSVKSSKMSSSKASKSEAVAAAGSSKSGKSKSDSTKFLKKLKPPPGSGGKSLRKVREKQKQKTTATATVTTKGSVAATNSTAPDSVSTTPNKTVASSSNDVQRKTASTKGTTSSSSTKPVSGGGAAAAGGGAAAAVAPAEPLAKKDEVRAEDVPKPVDRMKMNFDRRFSGQSSKRADTAAVVAEAASAAQTQVYTTNPKLPASTETPQQEQKANSAGATFSDPIAPFPSRSDLQFKQNFEKEEINSIWTEDPSLGSRNKAQAPNTPSRAAAVAKRLFGAVHLEPCSAGWMDKEYEEDGTVGSLTMQTEEGTFATARTRRETIVDDLADLGLLVGRMCQQRGFSRVVDFDDDETMTTAYGGHGGFPREVSSIDGTDDGDTFQQQKLRWLKGLNAEAMRSFGERRGFPWARATEEAYEDDEDEDTSHYTEGSTVSASFVDETDASLEDDQDGTITTAEGTEVDISAVAQASQPAKSIINSTASIRSNKSKRSNKTPQQPPPELQQQNKTPPQQQQSKTPPQLQQQNRKPPQLQQQPPPFEEVLISGSSESNSTTELVFTALGPMPAKDAASRISADKTKKTTATDDESPKNVMQTPSVDANVKSFTQSLVDMVTNAITPVPNSHDGADTFNVPSVLEADFENGSVGELTATTLEMQVEMAEFRKQLEKLQKDAREANGGQIQSSEITAAAEAAMAKQQAKGGGHAV